MSSSLPPPSGRWTIWRLLNCSGSTSASEYCTPHVSGAKKLYVQFGILRTRVAARVLAAGQDNGDRAGSRLRRGLTGLGRLWPRLVGWPGATV